MMINFKYVPKISVDVKSTKASISQALNDDLLFSTKSYSF